MTNNGQSAMRSVLKADIAITERWIADNLPPLLWFGLDYFLSNPDEFYILILLNSVKFVVVGG